MASIEKRPGPDGQTVFRVKVRLKGTSPVTATFERLTDARRWAQSTETAIRERRHFPGAESRRRTVGEVIDRYERDVLPHKPRSAKDQMRQLRWWKARL